MAEINTGCGGGLVSSLREDVQRAIEIAESAVSMSYGGMYRGEYAYGNVYTEGDVVLSGDRFYRANTTCEVSPPSDCWSMIGDVYVSSLGGTCPDDSIVNLNKITVDNSTGISYTKSREGNTLVLSHPYVESVEDIKDICGSPGFVVALGMQRGGVFVRDESDAADDFGVNFSGYRRVFDGDVRAEWFSDIPSAVKYASQNAAALLCTRGTVLSVPEMIPSLDAALDLLSDKNREVTILLSSGYTVREQVVVRGRDMSGVTIASEDPIVPARGENMNIQPVETENYNPMFSAIDGGKLPKMQALFEFVSDPKDGVFIYNASSVTFSAAAYGSATAVSGVRNARRGLTVFHGSSAVCVPHGVTQTGTTPDIGAGADFSGASDRALQVQHGSSATMVNCNFNDSGGDNAVYVIWGSTADIYRSTATGHRGTNAAIHSRDGSVLNARQTDASNAVNRGYHALHAATLNARSGVAKNCQGYGVIATSGSTIDCTEIDVTGSRVGIYASDASRIEAYAMVSTTSGKHAVQAVSASTVSVRMGSVSNTANCAILSEEGSVVNADSISIDTAEYGIRCREGSVVNADKATIANVTYGIRAEGASTVNATSATINNTTDIAIASYGSSCVECPSVIIGGAAYGLKAVSGDIGATAAVVSASNIAVYASTGARVTFGEGTASGGSYDIYISRGSVVQANNAAGECNIADSTTTEYGVIYR